MTEFFDSEPSHMWYWQSVIGVELLIGTGTVFLGCFVNCYCYC